MNRAANILTKYMAWCDTQRAAGKFSILECEGRKIGAIEYFEVLNGMSLPEMIAKIQRLKAKANAPKKELEAA